MKGWAKAQIEEEKRMEAERIEKDKGDANVII